MRIKQAYDESQIVTFAELKTFDRFRIRGKIFTKTAISLAEDDHGHDGIFLGDEKVEKVEDKRAGKRWEL